jgi:hypothetical protein
MWDVPRYRIRAYVRALKRARVLEKEKSDNRMHLKRVRAGIRVFEGFASRTEPTVARMILNDITAKGTYVFSPVPFRLDELVEVTVSQPRMFYVKGRVIACERVSPDSIILSEDPVPYRIAVAFEFQSMYERETVKAFIQHLQLEELYPSANKQVA